MRPDPKLVVNSVAVMGLPVTAFISRTFFIEDDHENILIQDADVRLFVNGEEKEQMKWMNVSGKEYKNGFYVSSYIPQVNDQISIRVNKEDYPLAEATVEIPRAVEIDEIGLEAKVQNLWGMEYYLNTYTLSFQDDPVSTDYYYLFCETGLPEWDQENNTFTGEYLWVHRSLNYQEEPLFSAEISALDRIFGYVWLNGYGRTFNDHLINGKNYTFHLKDQHYYINMLDEYRYYYPESFDMEAVPESERLPVLGRFSLYTLSESFYLYLKSITELGDSKLINDLIYAGLAEPIRVYNNISGGVGVLGGCNPGSKIFELGHFEPQEKFTY